MAIALAKAMQTAEKNEENGKNRKKRHLMHKESAQQPSKQTRLLGKL